VAGAVADGAAAIGYVRTRSDVNPERIALYGQSLGAALAVASAARAPAGVRALVLEGAFYCYRSIARDRLSRSALTWAVQWLPWLVISDRFGPHRIIGRLQGVSFLFVHGDADPIVPIHEGRRLYAVAPEPKEFWTVPGGRHLEAFTKYAGDYRPRLAAFLHQAFSKGP